jgi:hypothetical protein
MINILTEISLSSFSIYLLIATTLKPKEKFRKAAMLVLYILHIHDLHEKLYILISVHQHHFRVLKFIVGYHKHVLVLTNRVFFIPSQSVFWLDSLNGEEHAVKHSGFILNPAFFPPF